jgi:UrcA family protein
MENEAMNTLAKTTVNALVALGLAGTAAAPAFATAYEHRTVTVSAADIDLGTAKGQKILDNRVERAVRDVCRTPNLDTGSRIMNSDALNCLTKARADAKRQVAALKSNEQRGG